MTNLESLIQLKEKFGLNTVTEAAIKQEHIKQGLLRHEKYHDLDWYNQKSLEMLNRYYTRIYGVKK